MKLRLNYLRKDHFQQSVSSWRNAGESDYPLRLNDHILHVLKFKMPGLSVEGSNINLVLTIVYSNRHYFITFIDFHRVRMLISKHIYRQQSLIIKVVWKRKTLASLDDKIKGPLFFFSTVLFGASLLSPKYIVYRIVMVKTLI